MSANEIKSDVGRRIASGAYGPGTVTAETKHALTMMLDCGAEVAVNRAGNLYYLKSTGDVISIAHKNTNMKTRLFANIPGSPSAEDRVKITSRFCGGKVYVSRLVKSTGRWGKKRWLIDESTIRKVEVAQ